MPNGLVAAMTRIMAPALDVPFERDLLAQQLADEGADIHQIANAYGVTHEAVRLIVRRAERRFAGKWRLLFGNECPFADHRGYRGGRNAEDM
jgi:hypothetical protein